MDGVVLVCVPVLHTLLDEPPDVMAAVWRAIAERAATVAVSDPPDTVYEAPEQLEPLIGPA